MALSNDLISQFVKITNDTKSTTKNTTVYGTVIISDGKKYVQLDGSPDGMLTPVDTITDVEDKDRVIVDIQDHTATITGNLTTPSVNENSTVQNGDGTSTKITDLGIAIADKVSAKTLNAEIARIDTLEANEATITGNLNANTAAIGELKTGVATIEGKLTAAEADIDDLEADNVTIKDTLTANKIEVDGKISANEASINKLDANYAEFKNTTTNNLEAVNAGIENLETKKLDADTAEITYANIDFSNIGKAAMEYFYANSGLIQDVTVDNGTITGNLVGVTISGDLIEGNTVKADKLVVLGSDGLYYKLNFESGNFTDAEEVPTDSLHGSVITANSITAEKVSVSDLVAFGAKIGGFTITDNSIYSGVKESIDNPTRGLYFDNNGQLYLGDTTNFLRYYYDSETDTYKLEIAAESVLFGVNSKTSAEDLKNIIEHIHIGTYTDPDTGEVEPSISLYEDDTDFKQIITNTKTVFTDGSVEHTAIRTDGVITENVTIKNELKHGGFVWSIRANGNYGLMWKE